MVAASDPLGSLRPRRQLPGTIIRRLQCASWHIARRHTGVILNTLIQGGFLRVAGLLPPRHVQLLDELGIEWQPQLTASEARWQACFGHLVDFARQHNHCKVLPLSHSNLCSVASGRLNIGCTDWYHDTMLSLHQSTFSPLHKNWPVWAVDNHTLVFVLDARISLRGTANDGRLAARYCQIDPVCGPEFVERGRSKASLQSYGALCQLEHHGHKYSLPHVVDQY